MDLTVKIGDVVVSNPVGVASGTFGYGSEYEQLIDLKSIGALFTKAVTWEPRPGNRIPRIIETTSGLLNSIGLANVGREGFAKEKYPFLSGLACSTFVNVAGNTEDDYARTVEWLDEHAPLTGYELNVSCPNVKEGGLSIGGSARMVEAVTQRVRAVTDKPVIVKLTPNVTDITEIARAAEAAGADALSAMNTLVGMVIDVDTCQSVLPGKTGGLSGPAVLPVGVAIVYRVSRAVSIPVIGIGGIEGPDSALQYLLAGASALQIGTANFVDPTVTDRVLDGIRNFLSQHNLTAVSEIASLLDR
ncbi:MAG: dihydroorotate dehydrogenase [Spirochaetaceae bacterium]|nr:MAG: dihydroorotate dehydrogenase [Spirochaetaceae bacterium]